MMYRAFAQLNFGRFVDDGANDCRVEVEFRNFDLRGAANALRFANAIVLSTYARQKRILRVAYGRSDFHASAIPTRWRRTRL